MVYQVNPPQTCFILSNTYLIDVHVGQQMPLLLFFKFHLPTCMYMEISMEDSQNNSAPGYRHKRFMLGFCRDTCIPVLIPVAFLIVKIWDKPRYPAGGEQRRKLWYICNRILFNQKEG